LQKNSNAEIVALCEKNEAILQSLGDKYKVPPQNRFTSDADFFAAGRLAGALVIATQDKDHYGHVMQAIRMGYDILLEKPLSPNPEECEDMLQAAKEKGIKAVVCHVLRYSGFYDAVKKEIGKGTIGNVVSINDTENVGYWHFSHSYVRGNWRNEGLSGPSLLAKCCHDLDMIYYLSGKACKNVFSVGSLQFFQKDNAPAGAPPYCLQGCPAKKSCPYHVRKIYYGFTRHTIPLLYRNKTLITGKRGAKRKELIQTLKTSPYGRCVFQCDNDVMENQTVALSLADGVKATLTMTAFSKWCFRRIHISGTKGEIIGCDKDGKFKVNVFGGASKTVKIKGGSIFSHLGGDANLIKDFIAYLESGQKTSRLSLLEATLESHRMAFAAERSRKTGLSVSIEE
jgi:predicted dehydrogenase